MIPLRLQFSGIRDYESTEMNLGQEDEHILITGPNGAGKSTISFCMGAVLRSSKVDVEGLKSQNLPEDQTWRATVRYLFKNEGASRIDAPLYVEFRLVCEQLPKQPIKLQYEIHDGDEVEHLELRQTFRSGDAKQNNFGAYRRELEIKYKIHPDLYYLIWYQQEVNQFSVMTPEERFRIFSEMHRIDRIQKDWETSLEVVKEAQEAFEVAVTQQKMYEQNLNIARTEKLRFESNKRRIEENGFQYALTTNELKKAAEKEQLEMEKYIEARAYELDELNEKERELLISLEEKQQKSEAFTKDKEQCEKELIALEENEVETNVKLSEVQSVVDSLRSELSDLQEAYEKLPYSEIETKKKWQKAKEQVKNFEEREDTLKKRVIEAETEIEKTRKEASTIQAEVEQWIEQSKGVYELIKRYTSSHELKENLSKIEASLEAGKENRTALTEKLRVSKDELSMFEKNKIESVRQREAIRHLKQQNINAYTLRHFVKLMSQTSIEQERLYDAIKYTIFYDATTCQPLNDLYHVSLRKLIPDRAILELTRFGLDKQEGLTEAEQNHATRVLWWIEQFYSEDFPQLKDGLLIDQRGVRGPQERDTFILSEKALLARKKQLEQQVQKLTTELQVLKKKIEKDNEVYRIWNADVQKVIEAEAFLSKKDEQKYRIEQIEKFTANLEQLQQTKIRCEEEGKEIWKQTYEVGEEVKSREADLLVYEEFGQQTIQIERLQHQENHLKQLKHQEGLLKHKNHERQKELDKLLAQIRETTRAIENLEDETSRYERVKGQIIDQKKEKDLERIAKSTEGLRYKEELDGLYALIPRLVEKALVENQSDESRYSLQNRQNLAKVEFENAMNEENIDVNAVENYLTLEHELQRKQEELHSAKNLLEDNEVRAIKNEERLETAISMQVQKINFLFSEYIGNFQFEGQIKYEKALDKKGRPTFRLFIYVRKEGHRGKLADVSLKARGGRVGKGVSGGEESLSSLLFALALLQNLENQAGFIVLDEFDSALDDNRKAAVFELYAEKLNRKLIILSPKAHENEYYNQFRKAFIISHDPAELISKVRGVAIKGS